MTMDELIRKGAEFRKGAGTYSDNAALMDDLLEMCVQAGAFTPADAARQLGISVESWLASRAA